MYESPMSNYIKKYYLDAFALTLHLLYVDRLMKELYGIDIPEFKMNAIKEDIQQDSVYLNELKKKGMF